MRQLLLMACLALAGPVHAQVESGTDELLASDRPEAWAMHYVGAATLMTAFGESPSLAPGQWGAALDLGHIPRLNAQQQRVGLRGFKQEDLNKSPVFGRARLSLGLPGAWVAELGWTPPVEINGLRTRNLLALAFGRRLLVGDAFTLSARVFGQHGSAEGDITCPAAGSGVVDPQANPVGCIAASDDRIALRHYGADVTAAWASTPWHWYASLGIARMEPEAHVDAQLGSYRDRSRLVARGNQPFVALGIGRDLDARWRLSLEALHVPLPVRRDPDATQQNDPLTSLRIQLRYQAR